jgi:hypothetical protein
LKGEKFRLQHVTDKLGSGSCSTEAVRVTRREAYSTSAQRCVTTVDGSGWRAATGHAWPGCSLNLGQVTECRVTARVKVTGKAVGQWAGPACVEMRKRKGMTPTGPISRS